ncbi:MAG: hypothetical protein LBC18_11585 [Opitutaceae bacterium]|nr:hypothetical protein [Opitutaceae bacterium]
MQKPIRPAAPAPAFTRPDTSSRSAFATPSRSPANAPRAFANFVRAAAAAIDTFSASAPRPAVAQTTPCTLKKSKAFAI